MNKKLKTVQIVVIILAIVFGTLLHFTYEWSGENRIVGLFSATNESVWEHLKLVFYPMLILAIVEYFVVKKEANNYIEAKSLGIFLAIAFIIVFGIPYYLNQKEESRKRQDMYNNLNKKSVDEMEKWRK